MSADCPSFETVDLIFSVSLCHTVTEKQVSLTLPNNKFRVYVTIIFSVLVFGLGVTKQCSAAFITTVKIVPAETRCDCTSFKQFSSQNSSILVVFFTHIKE